MKEIKLISDACKAFKKEAIQLLGTEQSVFENENHHGLFDIVILTATIGEFNSILSLLENSKEVVFNSNDVTIYHSAELRNAQKRIKILLPFPNAQGIEAAAVITTKTVQQFRPKYLFMVGICAGNKNTCKIGDIIVAEKSLNYQQVVNQENSHGDKKTKFNHSLNSIQTNLKSKLELFASSNVFKKIQSDYPESTKLENQLKCSIGIMVTGSSLQRSQSIMEDVINTYTNVKGMDMETHGVYNASTLVYSDYAPNVVSIKSVSDFGDNTSKHKLNPNERKEYALYTSSHALKEFILAYLL